MKTSTYLVLLAGFFCSLAAQAQQEGSQRKIINVISTEKNTEFAPTISADGRTLIFESNVDKDKGWELFESKLDDAGNWTEPYPLKNINDKCNFLAGPSLSYDGNTLYFTAFIDGVTNSEDIYYSTRLDEKNWSEPKSIGAPINTDDGYEGFPSISADGNSIYFIRLNEDNPGDKKSKEACFKIYVSYKNDDGVWQEPAALPAPINLACERDPIIMADNHTLIFSSIRAGGKGKYDMYQTSKQPDGSWSAPVPLDFVNSVENDQSPCISASGDLMYFYSLDDIYSVPIPLQYRQRINVTVQGSVKSEKTKAAVKVQIVVKNLNSKEEYKMTNNPNDGKYSLILSAGQKYEVYFINEKYLAEIADFDLSKQEKYLEIRKDVLLKSDYTLDLTVVDPDIKQPITAWVDMEGNGTIYKDSAKVSQYPLKLTLQAAQDYTIKSSAPRHPLAKEILKFDPVKTRPQMNYTFNLLYEKSKYIAAVTNVATKQKAKIKVYFNNETVNEVVVAEAGDVAYLRKGDRYQVVTSSDKGYLFSSMTIVAGEGEMDENGNYVLNMIIIPIVEGAALTLNHITFKSNSADLNASSFLELDQVIDLMNKNPGLSIEIAAHTDDVGAEDYNVKLSEKRASSVVKYLAQKGTSTERLKPVGFGKNKPIVPNDSDENRAKNRRVELKVLKVS